MQDVYTLDTTSNEKYYILYKNGEYFSHLPKKGTDLEFVKKYFNIKE